LTPEAALAAGFAAFGVAAGLVGLADFLDDARFAAAMVEFLSPYWD
jgi:hypothetical protein